MTVEHRRLHDAGGNHQSFILEDLANFIDNTALFAHAALTIRQQRQHVKRQLTAKEIFIIDGHTVEQLRALTCQRINGFFTVCGSGDQAGHADTRQAAFIDQRFQRRQQLAGQAVGDGDDVAIAVIGQYKRVHFRHNQRYVRLQRKQTAEIDNQTTGIGRLINIGRTRFNAGGKKGQLYLGPVKYGSILHDHRLTAKTQMLSRALIARQRIDITHRELTFSKGVEQGFADGARCAQYGNIPAFRHGGLLQRKATLPEYPTGSLRRH